ncbi:hypothetical protein TMatcc_005944 [Talaromyces marneffei ATCC 18224]
MSTRRFELTVSLALSGVMRIILLRRTRWRALDHHLKGERASSLSTENAGSHLIRGGRSGLNLIAPRPKTTE